jgi:chromosome segregation ATPase
VSIKKGNYMQRTIKNISLAVPTLVLALTALVTVPAFAQHGSADSSSGSSGNGGSSTTSHDATETESNDTQGQTELRHKGQQMVTELEQEHKSGKSAAEKTKACEAHKQGLTNKFSHITTNATNLETKIGTFLTRAETYQSTNNVTVANWDTLVAAANTAKTNADTAIANLKAVTPTLDCNSTSVASDVATFKAAAQTTRDALKAYKTAVKDVFVALMNAKGDSTDTTTTTGGTTND